MAEKKFDKVREFLLAKRNRGFTVALAILVVLSVGGVVWLATGGPQGGSDEPDNEGTRTVQVPPSEETDPPTVPDETTEPTQEPTEPQDPTDEPTTDPSEEPAPDETPNEVAEASDFPTQLPVPEGAKLTELEHLTRSVVVHATVPDSAEAVEFYNDILVDAPSTDYYVMSRHLTPDGMSARFGIEGPGFEGEAILRINDDNTMSLTMDDPSKADEEE